MNKNMQEIELKYLLKEVPLDAIIVRIETIEQYYCDSAACEEMRVRQADVYVSTDTFRMRDAFSMWKDFNKYLKNMGTERVLTIKRPTDDSAIREEVEKEITKLQYEDYIEIDMLPIHKTRFYIKTKYKFESIDFYEDPSIPPVYEVEFNTEEDKNSFVPHDWLGANVTGVKELKNKTIYEMLQKEGN